MLYHGRTLKTVCEVNKTKVTKRSRYMIQFIGNIQIKQIHSDSVQISGCQGL